ncbi:MAG: HsdR family type I site-specific deoxyribonuclease [Bacteroidales bacterium]|nr:HsdR family type I site-specific deoxyribonuclease [Bacteroidales bacterium]
MSEYTNVERPFLDKLREIGWTVIDKGACGIPQDPADSLRTSFDEVVLKDVFYRMLGELNPWITAEQKDYCYEKITDNHGALIDVNRTIHKLLVEGIHLRTPNEQTGEENPTAKIINFDRYQQNSFIAINQFRVNTHNTKPFIIPDIVCFVNGLPLVVIECKDEDVSEPMSEAFTQIQRYANRRTTDDPFAAGIEEGCERLFHTNLFSVITHGTEARCGTLSADFDFYLNWRDIFPEEYAEGVNIEPSGRQEILIKGMFNHEILIDIFRNFTLFKQKGDNTIKLICRYPQYRAVGKMIEKLQKGTDWKSRSGVIWHTQGSGKSLTMVFLVRKMRHIADLRTYKILMVVDRQDLEDQLAETAEDTGELRHDPKTKKIENIVENRQALVKLEDDSADLNLVMIHKFGENKEYSLESLIKSGIVPQYETFPVINASDKILILIDEAHRSQGGEMGDNLFQAFPNAARIGFTGTPLITPHHKATTCERFGQKAGDFIDTYKMNDSVRDRATVDIKYIGRQSEDHIPNKDEFDEAFEQTFRNCTSDERIEIQKRYGTMIAYLESADRVMKNARDMMTHFVSDILPNGFKAQVVASSILAAVRYKIALERLIPEFIKAEETKSEADRDEVMLQRLRMLKVRAVVSSQGNNEDAIIRDARLQAAADDAIANYKKDFNPEDPATGIGILCVCDRLLTGFDAPVEQVMYLDKNLSEHNLMQAITRVNRTKANKTHGLVVDYFGVTKNLNKALGIYNADDEKAAADDLREFETYFKAIEKEIPELEMRYNKILQRFEEEGIADIQDFLEQKMNREQEKDICERIVKVAESVKFRSEFDALLRLFFDIFDLLFNEPTTRGNYYVPAKRLAYLVALIRWNYKDETLDLKWASEKVRRLLDKYLKSEGVRETVPEVDIFSDDFPKIINKMYKNPQTIASAMAHQIRDRIIIKLGEGRNTALYQKFKDRMDNILSIYADNWDAMITELEQLRQEMANPKPSVVSEEKEPFYDKLCQWAGVDFEEQHDHIVALTDTVMRIILEAMSIPNLWTKPTDVEALRGKLGTTLRFSGIPVLKQNSDAIVSELIKLAKSNESVLRREA